MNQRHPHADVIIAWVNGEEIELWGGDEWVPWLLKTPPHHLDHSYRIKPKRVKKEGWIGVQKVWTTERVYETEEECKSDCNGSAVIIRIEWEEDA